MAILPRKLSFCVFEPSPRGRGVAAMYDDHHKLIGKRVVDFLLVLIELFSARCYGWGATSEYRLKIGDFALTGAGWPTILSRRGRPQQPFFSENYRLNDLSYRIKIWTDLSTVFSQSMRLTDEQTDRILIARPRLHFAFNAAR